MKEIQLVYSSNASPAFSMGDFEDILVVAREKNKAKNITGMLIFIDGIFIQCLEGPEEEVKKLYSQIYIDDRHFNVHLLGEIEITERAFPDWEMGFKNILPTDLEEIGAQNAKEVLAKANHQARSLIKFLEFFLNDKEDVKDNVAA